MTSTIKVNNIQNQCGANIINESSNTITIGASGDTISLASGASQTGFGRTGTVDWQTGSIKTTTFTAVSGQGFFVNTTSGAVTGNLPASPSAGDIVAFADYAGTAGSNKITIGRNGSNIEGAAVDAEITNGRDAVTLVYVDGTQGWVAVNDNESSVASAAFISATGGNTVTTCGNFKIHTFTGPGTFTVCSVGNPVGSNTVSYMVVAGGGGGGGGVNQNFRSGGGGAGGFRESKASSDSYTASPLNATSGPTFDLPVSVQGYPITVGAGGAGGQHPPGTPGVNGNNSVFSTITSAGGGTGGTYGGDSGTPPVSHGSPGGSGGGSGGCESYHPSESPGGTGNTPPVSPPQGQNGGTGKANPNPAGPAAAGGGGGGAGQAGNPGANPSASIGFGGNGVTTNISGSPVARAGGGGSGQYAIPGVTPQGGSGGGGNGHDGATPSGYGAGSPGTANTGGGGGGTSGLNDSGNGGSGIVIIRYKFQ